MDGDTANGNIVWNNFSTAGTASDTITFTTSGTDTEFSWYPVFDYKDWLPYHYDSYQPKWHILLGYKSQISNMWD